MKDIAKEFLSSFQVFSEDEVHAVIDSMEVVSYKKGAVLLREGEVTSCCYFILKGCIREYQLLDGAEKTTAFYTEGQAVVSYDSYLQRSPSRHYLACIEDCLLMAGTRDQEIKLHQLHPRLEFLTHTILQKDYQQVQQQLSAMIALNAEERYEHLLATRPELILRVPQHHIASFIGMTPESLSRIRKRIAKAAQS